MSVTEHSTSALRPFLEPHAPPTLLDVAFLVAWSGFGEDISAALIATSRAFYFESDALLEGPYGLARLRYPRGLYSRGTRLMHAAKVGNVARVRQLLRAGADVHFGYECTDAALRLAVEGAHTSAALALVEAGSDVDAAFSREEGYGGILKSCGTDVDSFVSLVLRLNVMAPDCSPWPFLLTGMRNHSVALIAHYLTAGMADGKANFPSQFRDAPRAFFLSNFWFVGSPCDKATPMEVVAAARAFYCHEALRFPENLKFAGEMSRNCFCGPRPPHPRQVDWMKELCIIPDPHPDAALWDVGVPGLTTLCPERAWVHELCISPDSASRSDIVLWAASCAGLTDIVEKQLRDGVDPMVGAEDFAILCAAEAGHSEVVGILVAAIIASGNSEHISCALIAASLVGNLEAAKRCLEMGADASFGSSLSYSGWNDKTALNEAVAGGFVEIVALLLAFGATYWYEDIPHSLGYSLRTLPRERGSAIARDLSSHGFLLPPVQFCELVYAGAEHLVCDFIDGGQNVNMIASERGEFQSFTPLHAACYFRSNYRNHPAPRIEVRLRILRRLCDVAGVALNVHLRGGPGELVNNGIALGGSTPLIIAVRAGDVEIVRELCKRGASVTEACSSDTMRCTTR